MVGGRIGWCRQGKAVGGHKGPPLHTEMLLRGIDGAKKGEAAASPFQSVKEPPNRQNVNLENVFMTHRQKTLEGEIAFAII